MYACGERGGWLAGPRPACSHAHNRAQHAASRALRLVASSVGHRVAGPRPFRNHDRHRARMPAAKVCCAATGLLACKPRHARNHAQHSAEHAASRACRLAAAAMGRARALAAAASVASAADPTAAAPIAATPIAAAPTPCESSVTRVTTTSIVPCADSANLSGVGSPGDICSSEISADPRSSFLPTLAGGG